MCLDKSPQGNDKRLEGNGGPSGGVPHCLRRSAQAWTCAIGAGPSAIRAAAARNGLVDLDLFASGNFLELRKAEVRRILLLGTSVHKSGHASSEARSDHTGSRCSGLGLRGLLLLSVLAR
jgi:hypothetical protein